MFVKTCIKRVSGELSINNEDEVLKGEGPFSRKI